MHSLSGQALKWPNAKQALQLESITLHSVFSPSDYE